MTLRVDWTNVSNEGKANISHDGGYEVGVLMMLIGLPQIKNEKDALEAYRRTRFYSDLLNSPFTVHDSETGEPRSADLKWFESLIGLYVNVTPYTWVQFRNHMISNWQRDFDYELRKNS